MFPRLPLAVKVILAINVVVFVLQLALNNAPFYPFMLWPLGGGDTLVMTGTAFDLSNISLSSVEKLQAGASAASAAPRTRTTETPDAGAAAQVERSAALDAGQSAPVDAERVKVIREAIEKGAYPVIPTRIADAMIAAGMLLRTAAQ